MIQQDDNIRVLLIDDSDIDREAVMRHIYNVFCVLEARTGREALQVASMSQPACVLLDYRLPDMDGFQLLEQFVDEETPVVMLTGQGTEEVAAKAIKMGAEDYLAKSMLTKSSLTRAVRNALEKFRLRRDLEQQQQDIADFVAFASSEIRGLLTGIMSSVETVRAELDGGRTQLDSIAGSARHLNTLVDAMVDYTKATDAIPAGHEVDLEQCVADAMDDLRPVIDATQTKLTCGRLPIVTGIHSSLREVFRHLLRNAIEYSPVRPPRIYTSSESHATMWRISVGNLRNEGDEARESVQPQAGLLSSIGLLTCAKVIRQHGGRLHLDPNGDGPTATFTLPRNAAL